MSYSTAVSAFSLPGLLVACAVALAQDLMDGPVYAAGDVVVSGDFTTICSSVGAYRRYDAAARAEDWASIRALMERNQCRELEPGIPLTVMRDDGEGPLQLMFEGDMYYGGRSEILSAGGDALPLESAGGTVSELIITVGTEEQAQRILDVLDDAVNDGRLNFGFDARTEPVESASGE